MSSFLAYAYYRNREALLKAGRSGADRAARKGLNADESSPLDASLPSLNDSQQLNFNALRPLNGQLLPSRIQSSASLDAGNNKSSSPAPRSVVGGRERENSRDQSTKEAALKVQTNAAASGTPSSSSPQGSNSEQSFFSRTFSMRLPKREERDKSKGKVHSPSSSNSSTNAYSDNERIARPKEKLSLANALRIRAFSLSGRSHSSEDSERDSAQERYLNDSQSGSTKNQSFEINDRLSQLSVSSGENDAKGSRRQLDGQRHGPMFAADAAGEPLIVSEQVFGLSQSEPHLVDASANADRTGNHGTPPDEAEHSEYEDYDQSLHDSQASTIIGDID
jgi:hypothetical protein